MGIDAAGAWNGGSSERVCQLQIAASLRVCVSAARITTLAENQLSKASLVVWFLFVLVWTRTNVAPAAPDYLPSSGFSL